jgi:uncharacterized protein DUF4878
MYAARLVSVALAGLALLAVSCGGSAPDETVRDYFTAIIAGDGERACGELTPMLRREIDRAPAVRGAGRTCVEVMELAAGLNPDLSEQDVEDLSIETEEEGERATARLQNPLVRREETINLAKVDDEWKISTLEVRPRG